MKYVAGEKELEWNEYFVDWLKKIGGAIILEDTSVRQLDHLVLLIIFINEILSAVKSVTMKTDELCSQLRFSCSNFVAEMEVACVWVVSEFQQETWKLSDCLFSSFEYCGRDWKQQSSETIVEFIRKPQIGSVNMIPSRRQDMSIRCFHFNCRIENEKECYRTII